MFAVVVGRIRSSLADLKTPFSLRRRRRRRVPTFFRSSFEDIVGLLEHVRRCFLERRNDRLIECISIGSDHRRLNGIGYGMAQTIHHVLQRRRSPSDANELIEPWNERFVSCFVSSLNRWRVTSPRDLCGDCLSDLDRAQMRNSLLE